MYKVPTNISKLTFKPSYGYCNGGPRLTDGIIYHGTIAILNELIAVIYDQGSEAFRFNNPEFEKLLVDTDFHEIKSNINNLEELSKYIPLDDMSILNNRKKWVFYDFDRDGWFKSVIPPMHKSITEIYNNPTYLYDSNSFTSNMLGIFKQFYKYKNVCIRMNSLTSPVACDFLTLICYSCRDVYIFRSKNQCKIKDTWYILGLDINENNVKKITTNEMYSKIEMNKKNPYMNSILEFESTEIRKVFSDFVFKTSFSINNTLINFY